MQYSAKKCTGAEQLTSEHLERVLAANLAPIQRSILHVEGQLDQLCLKLQRSAPKLDLQPSHAEAKTSNGNGGLQLLPLSVPPPSRSAETPSPRLAETENIRLEENGADTPAANGFSKGGMSMLSKAKKLNSSVELWKTRIETHLELADRTSSFGSHMLAFLTWLVDGWSNLREPDRSGSCLYKLVSSKRFGALSSAVIVVNIIVISITSDFEVKHIGEEIPPAYIATEFVCLGFFTVELLLRLWAHGLHFFANDEMSWNIFDALVVTISLVEVGAALAQTSDQPEDASNLVFMRIFRLLKMIKILRTFRLVKVFRELGTILHSFEKAVVALFWSMAMLAFLLFVFALVFVQGMSGFLVEEEVSESTAEAVRLNFGSLAHAMMSLYLSVSGGNDWVVYYDVAKLPGPFYAATFIFFTLFFTFAVFNVFTGVIVEKAFAAFTPDRSEQLLEERKKLVSEADDFRILCQKLDTQRTGRISLQDFMDKMQSETMVLYMSSVGLEVHDVELFFRVVAGDRQEVSLDEFVEGCMAMKGAATSLDVQKQLHETRLIMDRVQHLEQCFNHRIQEVIDLSTRALNGVRNGSKKIEVKREAERLQL